MKEMKDILPPRCEEQLAIPESHIESFNYFLNTGLSLAVKDLQPVEVEFPELGYVRFWFESVTINTPCYNSYDEKLHPSECRQLGKTYNAPCTAVVSFQANGGDIRSVTVNPLTRIPIMVKSDKCHIKDYSPVELCKHGEEPNEMGGYFIVNGLERLIRLLIVPRSNNPMAIKQQKNIQRGKLYTPYGIEIRCLRSDQTTNRNVVHYLSDGNCTMRFSLLKREYFVPVVVLLKAFVNTTDREIYEKLTLGDETNTFLTDRVELLLREAKQFGVTSPHQALSFLGSRFRTGLKSPKRHTDKSVGETVINQFILVHLTTRQSKFNYLIFLVRKLYAFVAGEIKADNPDSQANQDILLPGILYNMIFKEQLQEYLNAIKLTMDIDFRRNAKADFLTEGYFRRCLKRVPSIGQRVEHFLSTGNVTSNTGLDLLQKSGFTIIAEKLNYLRYLSHFRGVHRGQFFTTMKTTQVRKLLPDGWGFLCPVHTPDGSPCGLLNHISATCKVLTDVEPTDKLASKLASLGMKPIQSSIVYPSNYMTVLLDANIIGYVPPEISFSFVAQLRYLKVESDPAIPEHLEIVMLTSEVRGFPGIYLFSHLSRMTRPVTYLKTGKEEWIGTQEQVYMEIACVPDDVTKQTTHCEIAPMNMLSIVASLTPFSDFNQSPRNMYQCQMGKQTMATPCTAYKQRVDNKMYRIQTPQIPLVRNENQDKYRIDDFPNGTNAMVAVISYTGYDMEDAMIINKSSYERGFGHGSVYKTEKIDLRARGSSGFEQFANPKKRTPTGEFVFHEPSLDADGLPFVGQYLQAGDPYLCIHDTQVGKMTLKRYKSKEPAYVDSVTIVESNMNGVTNINLKLRVNRNPIIGDKFSSRHGQKGVLSKLWDTIDMPFTESGMTPDIIINPHAFPSRMTIGMLIESMAGKSASLHGIKVNSTPFRFDEDNTAVDHFGEQLVKAGYSYYGNEPMYSGISGTAMKADIFYGMVYYQRLRHMVSDKFQVRSTGPNNSLTRQPVKGRKMGGGIRLGEMERDSLLAHGASFMLHDRLLNCSDVHRGYVCSSCGSVVSPLVQPATDATGESRVVCTYCDTTDGIRCINLPFVYRYLTNELAAMNIRVALHIVDAANRK